MTPLCLPFCRLRCWLLIRFLSRDVAGLLAAMSDASSFSLKRLISEKKLLCRSVYRIIFEDDAALSLGFSIYR
jgi:hypothetical protein